MFPRKAWKRVYGKGWDGWGEEEREHLSNLGEFHITFPHTFYVSAKLVYLLFTVNDALSPSLCKLCKFFSQTFSYAWDALSSYLHLLEFLVHFKFGLCDISYMRLFLMHPMVSPLPSPWNDFVFTLYIFCVCLPVHIFCPSRIVNYLRIGIVLFLFA